MKLYIHNHIPLKSKNVNTNILIFLLLLAMPAFSIAQVNLVPNFGFEIQDSCANVQDYIERCTGWHKYSDSSTTPDYYNSCSTVGYLNVPYSFNGYQQDHRNCTAFIGLVTYGPTPLNYREHIGIELSQPLVIGQKYFLSFYTVMSELVYPNGYHFGMPSNGIGLRLSTVAYNGNNPCPIDNFAHLYSAAVINDSIIWNRISGSIIADSAYNYLIIGNFLDNATIDTMHYTCDSCVNSSSYYYVDDVCLSTDSLLCNGGIDLIPCNVGIYEQALCNEVNIYPNPAIGFVKAVFPFMKKAELNLYDLTGTAVFRNLFHDKDDCTLDISSVSPGCYLLQVINKENGATFSKKIIKL